MKIFIKLFLSHGLIGLISVCLVSFIFYILLRDALIDRTIDQLASINILKKQQIENYFSQIKKDFEFLESEELTTEKNNGVDVRFENEVEKFSRLYHLKSAILNGSNRFNIKHSIDSLVLVSIHDKVDLDCHCFHILDYTKNERPKLFYIFPILNSDFRYVIFQDDLSMINMILSETTGMGNTGESYLVGSDFKMRSTSRFFLTESPLNIYVHTKAVSNTFNKSLDSDNIIMDYRGEKVISYYRRIGLADLSWVIISEIDFDEAMKPIIHLRNYLILLVFFLMIIVLGITLFLSGIISKPILSLRHVLLKLAQGEVLKKNETKRRDELGQIQDATNQLIDTLERTTAFAYEIGRGNLDATFHASSEKDTLGQALVHMKSQLKKFNENEIRLIREKTSVVLEVQEYERRRIARELHDGVGQLLTAVRFRLEYVEDKVIASEIAVMIDDTISEIKRVSYNLIPSALNDFGLSAAINGLCENAKKYTTLKFDFQYVNETPDTTLNFDISIAVFRIAQEGINNIVKHAKANFVELHVIEKVDEIYLLLRDNGNGFDTAKQDGLPGLGLTNMKERAKLMNGHLEIESSNEGTTIELQIPIIDAKN